MATERRHRARTTTENMSGGGMSHHTRGTRDRKEGRGAYRVGAS